MKNIQMVNPIERTRDAMVVSLDEKIRVIVDSDEEIFGEKYVQAYNSMNRLVKYKKDAVQFR